MIRIEFFLDSHKYKYKWYSRVILVLNEVEFFLDSLARLCDSKFQRPPAPALKKEKHSFQCMFLADWWSSKIMITCTFWKLNCSTSWPYRTFEGLVINVLILDDGWITGWAKISCTKNQPPLFSTTLPPLKSFSFTSLQTWQNPVTRILEQIYFNSNELQFSFLFLIKTKMKQLLKSMYQPRFNIS